MPGMPLSTPTSLGWLVASVTALSFMAASGLHHAAAQSSPATEKTAGLLVELIRVDTSNPPGREAAIADLLAPRFKALGFEVDIIPTPQPGKSHFVARLKGDGTKRPILLAAHADVV